MAWNTPMTAVAGDAFTAAQFNLYVRDNLLETGPAKVTGAGQVLVGNAANTVVGRPWTTNSVSASESTSATPFGALTTPGPAVTATTGTRAEVIIEAQITGTSTAAGRMGVDVTGGTTATNSQALTQGGTILQAASYTIMYTNLTPGSNTFTAVYSSTIAGQSCTFANRRIIVHPLS